MHRWYTWYICTSWYYQLTSCTKLTQFCPSKFFSNVCLYVCFIFVYKCMYKNLIEVPSAPVWIYLEQGCVLFSKLTLKLDIPEYGIVSYVMAYDMVLPILVKPLPFDLAYCFVYVKRSVTTLEVCSVWRGEVCCSAMYLLGKASLDTISKTNEKNFWYFNSNCILLLNLILLIRRYCFCHLSV